MKIHFGHRVGKYDPSTELPRHFCAGSARCSLALCLFSKFSFLRGLPYSLVLKIDLFSVVHADISKLQLGISKHIAFY